MRDPKDPGTLDLETGRMLIGYARVSTDDQDLTSQRAELHAAGCSRIFAEKKSGIHANRPELARMLDHIRAGDVVTVTRLDRLAHARKLLDEGKGMDETAPTTTLRAADCQTTGRPPAGARYRRRLRRAHAR
jgi:hypothetical protein